MIPGLPSFFGGVRIIRATNMVETIEDWSNVRSPSRARRRMKRGHKQRIRYVTQPMQHAYRIGDAIIAHPEFVRKMRASLDSFGRQA